MRCRSVIVLLLAGAAACRPGPSPVLPEAEGSASHDATDAQAELPSLSPEGMSRLKEAEQLREADAPTHEDYRLAVGLLHEVLAEQPGHALALRILADTLLDLGQEDEALEAAQRCVQADPGQADAWLTVALLSETRQAYAAAEQGYGRYIELTPEGRYADQAREALHRVRGALAATSDNDAVILSTIEELSRLTHSLATTIRGAEDWRTGVQEAQALLNGRKDELRAKLLHLNTLERGTVSHEAQETFGEGLRDCIKTMAELEFELARQTSDDAQLKAALTRLSDDFAALVAP